MKSGGAPNHTMPPPHFWSCPSPFRHHWCVEMSRKQLFLVQEKFWYLARICEYGHVYPSLRRWPPPKGGPPIPKDPPPTKKKKILRKENIPIDFVQQKRGNIFIQVFYFYLINCTFKMQLKCTYPDLDPPPLLGTSLRGDWSPVYRRLMMEVVDRATFTDGERQWSTQHTLTHSAMNLWSRLALHGDDMYNSCKDSCRIIRLDWTYCIMYNYWVNKVHSPLPKCPPKSHSETQLIVSSPITSTWITIVILNLPSHLLSVSPHFMSMVVPRGGATWWSTKYIRVSPGGTAVAETICWEGLA